MVRWSYRRPGSRIVVQRRSTVRRVLGPLRADVDPWRNRGRVNFRRSRRRLYADA
jgi:hypothetical protein